MRAYVSGSCRRSQRSFGAVKPVSARFPVSSISRSSPTRRLDLGALGLRPLVVPEHRGAQDAVLRVEHDEAVHLPGEADRPFREALRGTPAAARHQSSGSCSAQPGLRRRERVLLGRRREHAAVRRDRDGLDAGRADVEPDQDVLAHRGSGAEGGVDELVGADGVLRLLRLAEGGPVDLRGDAVDEVPLQHRPLDSADGVLGVRVEVEAEALAVVAVAGAAKLDRRARSSP